MATNTEKGTNMSQVNASVSKLLSKIKVGKVKGSIHIALATLDVLEDIISKADDAKPFQLSSMLCSAGGMLHRGAPQQPHAANVARRVHSALRAESRTNANSGEVSSGESLQKLVLARPARRGTVGDLGDLRERIRDHILELRLELESTVTSIASQAVEHIDSDSVVMCAVDTPLVEQFLKRAAKEHTYRLVLPEGPSIHQTHGLAARMSECGIPVTVITNAAVFAVMSRITKVIVSVSCVFGSGAMLAAPNTHNIASAAQYYNVPVIVSVSCVFGSGAMLAAPNTHNIASAAQYYNVPVLALCPLYKLTPVHAADPQEIPWGNPLHLHNYADHESESGHVYTPLRDYISPDHITLYITNLGGSSPSYIYRTMSELYDPADNELYLSHC